MCFWGASQKSKYKSLKVRAMSTVIFISSFVVIIWLGHVPLMLMILAIQACLALACYHGAAGICSAAYDTGARASRVLDDTFWKFRLAHWLRMHSVQGDLVASMRLYRDWGGAAGLRGH